MARPKGSKNKVKKDVVVIPTWGRGRPRKEAKAVKPQEKVLPNVDFESEEPDNEVKVIQCPYMGPDADDSEVFVRQQIIGNRKWNEEDIGDNFSITVDNLY